MWVAMRRPMTTNSRGISCAGWSPFFMMSRWMFSGLFGSPLRNILMMLRTPPSVMATSYQKESPSLPTMAVRIVDCLPLSVSVTAYSDQPPSVVEKTPKNSAVAGGAWARPGRPRTTSTGRSNTTERLKIPMWTSWLWCTPERDDLVILR